MPPIDPATTTEAAAAAEGRLADAAARGLGPASLAVLDLIDEAVRITDPATHEVLFLNRAGRALLGDKGAWLCQRALSPPPEPGRLGGAESAPRGERAGAAQRSEHFDPRLRRWFHCVEQAARWPDGRLVRFELAVDITEVRREDVARRAQIEERMRSRLRVEEAIALVSRHFVSFEETDLEEVLHILGETVDACRAYIFRFRDGLAHMDNTDEWTRPGVSPQRDNLQGLESNLLPWWTRQLRDGVDLVVPDVGQLPVEASAERAILEAQEIRALVVVPIHTQSGALTGFLGFDDTRAPRQWAAEDVRALRMVGEMVGILWERRATAERLRQTEAQLVHAQKMEAVGRLAGGVAHDFNNLLTAIAAHTEFALGALPDAALVAEDLREVQANAARATELTQQLLAFSRKQPSRPRVVDLNQIVGGLERMLSRVIGADVTLVVQLAEGLWPVRLDPGQMEQVIVNLAVNARDALPGGGTLTVRTANVMLDEGVVAQAGAIVPGPYVVLTVSDTGCGMTDEVLARLFEPFFSTKDGGKGTGLGLAMVYGLVTQNGGAIRVRSAPGRGATFDLYFPRSVERAAERPAAPPHPAVAGGSETILVVEDEVTVRNLAVRALAKLGYHVIAAEDGLAALALCGERPTPLDLVVSDVVMPRMGGVELVSRLRARWPAVPVIFVSGYTEDAVAQAAALGIQAHYIQKPFRLSALGECVRRVLDSRGDG